MSPGFRTPNPGTGLKETPRGLLYCEFHPSRILVLRGAPDPRAFVKCKGVDEGPGSGRWVGRSVPGFAVGQLLRQIDLAARFEAGEALREQGRPQAKAPSMSLLQVRRRALFSRFMEGFAPEVQREMREEYPSFDWQLLRLLHAVPAAREWCAQGHRALAYGLSQAWWLAPGSPPLRMAALRRWCARSPKDALVRLGLPPRRATLRILGRLVLSHAVPDVMARLRALMRDEEAFVRLCHAEAVSASLVYFLDPRFRSRITPAFLRSLPVHDSPGVALGYLELAGDLLVLENELDLRRRPRFASLDHLCELHDRAVEAARTRMLHIAGELPAPPVTLTPEETQTLRPLTTGRALLDEGTRQHHCLGSLQGHHTLARDGYLYAWAAEGPQRATIAIWFIDGRWRVYDVRRAHNQPVGLAVYRQALSLVKRANASGQTPGGPGAGPPPTYAQVAGLGPFEEELHDDREPMFEDLAEAEAAYGLVPFA